MFMKRFLMSLLVLEIYCGRLECSTLLPVSIASPHNPCASVELPVRVCLAIAVVADM